MYGENIGHRRKRQIDRRPAGRAEGVRLDVAAVADDVPLLRVTAEFHIVARREGQIGSVPGAALALAVAALAVIHENRFGRNGITDRAAAAAAGIGFTHVS